MRLRLWRQKPKGGVPFTMTPEQRRVAENFLSRHWQDTPSFWIGPNLTDAELRDAVTAVYDHPDGWEGFCQDRGLRL